MIKNILFIGLLSLVIGKTYAGDKEKGSDKRPNIIFLLTDDQRFNALGCMGNTEIQTPNIDKLADQGIMFTQHYNPTAICMGARATIMTGMYEHKTGCNFSHGALHPDKFELSYPMLMKKAGYTVGFAGKFGYAVKAEGNSSYHKYEDLPVDKFDWWKGWPGQGQYNTAENKYMVEYAEEYPHVSRALGAAAKDFMTEHGHGEKPFCLSISFKAPHGPVSPDPDFDHVYAGKVFTEEENYWRDKGEHLSQQSKQGRQYKKLGDHWKPEKYDVSLAKYYQLIYGIDQAVGMILEELKKQGLDENTIIMYTTDNGYHCGAHGFGGKVLPYEEGSRAPLLIYAPNAKGNGSVSNALTSNIDMAPTMLELAGIEVPANMDGVSLVPLLEKPNKEVKDHDILIQAWGENPTHCLSVVADEYKYLYWFYGKEMEPVEELFYLKDDEGEMNNLINEAAHAKQLSKMRSIYDTEVEKWKMEAVKDHGYEKYGILFDRHIPWSEKIGIMKEPKPGKEKKSKDKKKGKGNKKKKVAH
ncbi:sulfatase [Labilibacter sediminis]|nr:sulfatase [Labilibacter sediminis]